MQPLRLASWQCLHTDEIHNLRGGEGIPGDPHLMNYDMCSPPPPPSDVAEVAMLARAVASCIPVVAVTTGNESCLLGPFSSLTRHHEKCMHHLLHRFQRLACTNASRDV